MPVKTTVRKKNARRKPVKKKEASDGSYDKFKQFGKQQYTGMQVGRSHKWFYDQGEWKETKITPDLWRIGYDVTKRRAGKAPKGSGVPVGTAYHWYILAHQYVEKLNADDYSTALTGLKFKLAHKRADKDKWSAKTPTQRKHLIDFLKEVIHQLESEVVPIEFEKDGEVYKGETIPLPETCADGTCYQLDVTLNDKNLGVIRCLKSGWKMDRVSDKKLVNAIGNAVTEYYR